MKIVFATHNAHKVSECKQIANGNLQIVSLSEIGYTKEIEETGTTLEENALIKARTIYESLGENCFADDTGLEVDALDGRPGVYSARYAGENATYHENVIKLLKELEKHEQRSARFRTVVALILDGEEFLFSGEVEGSIINYCAGDGGFGYDPVFIPQGETLTFAQMSAEAKNMISHRGRAFQKLFAYLNSRYSTS